MTGTRENGASISVLRKLEAETMKRIGQVVQSAVPRAGSSDYARIGLGWADGKIVILEANPNSRPGPGEEVAGVRPARGMITTTLSISFLASLTRKDEVT